MASLKERFRARAAEDLEVMSAALDAADFEQLRERSHRLAGVAATFGYPEIGEAARALDDAVKGHASAADAGPAARRLLALLRLALSSPE